eukprot:TRINITY_DN4101_c0_g1_i1.p1 TRINITY_DN4101_c0_g1~~TRINITY_DN4101_c0_g1_i1.p1  ORF type:complete len:485 (-),score=25.13 TRINITY_DN4101_c0_g1_i1:1678-3132(-)
MNKQTEMESGTKETLIAAPTESEKVLTEANEPLSFYAKNIAKLAVPNTLTFVAWTAQNLIGIYYVGMLNDVKLLDGMSLGTTWISIFGYSLIFGFASALDTFVSQYYGKQDYKGCGKVLNRAVLIVGTMLIPCFFLLWISGAVFRLFGIDPEVAMYSYKVTMGFGPSVALFVPQILLEKFLIAQQISKPQMVIQLLNTFLYPLYCNVFVFTLQMDLYGVVAAKTISQVFYILGMIAYMRFSHCCEQTLTMPTKDVFSGWKEYLAIAFPSLFMVCLEWWGFEIMNLLSGKVGVVDLAANTIGMNYSAFVYLSCIGIGMSTGTLVGNSIGEMKEINAKMYALVGTLLTFIIVLILDSFILIFRHSLARLFTRDQEVVHVMEKLIFFIIVQELFDGTQGTLAKILIGMGRQGYASIINLVSYYAFMVPVGIIAGIWLGYGVYGIFFGYIIAGAIVCAGFVWIICKENWEQVIKEAAERGSNCTDGLQ